jgi:AcrR family transcriptional regulator
MQTRRTPLKDAKPAVKFRRMKGQRRGQIMAAARRLFAERGMSAVAIADITRAAGLSVGGFYLYFPNKEELLRQLLEEAGRTLRHTLGAAFQLEGSPLDRFENAGRAFFDKFCNGQRDMLVLILREAVGANAEIEEQRKAIFQLLIDDVVGAITRVSGRRGRAASRRAQVVAVSLLGMLERVAYHYYIWETGSKDRRKVAEEALAFIRAGLGSVLQEGN